MKMFPIALGCLLAVAIGQTRANVALGSHIPTTSTVVISQSSVATDGRPFGSKKDNLSGHGKPYEEFVKGRRYMIYSDPETQEECVRSINLRRRLHQSTPDLIIGWNSTGYTEERAKSIINDIEGNQKVKRGRYPYGESFFWYYDQNRHRSIDDAIRTWYSEGEHYDYNTPGFSQTTGGFTQLIWKSSREVTCVKVEYETTSHFKTLLVANFWPAGNVENKFPFNVLPPLRHPEDDDRPLPRPTQRPPRPTQRPEYERPRPPRPTQIPDYERPPYRPTSAPDYERPPYRPTRRPDYPDYDYPVHPISRFLGDVQYLEPLQTIVVVPQV